MGTAAPSPVAVDLESRLEALAARLDERRIALDPRDTPTAVGERAAQEPIGGAHRSWEDAAANLRLALREHLGQLRPLSGDALVQDRYEKFRRIGVFEETV